MAYRYEGEVTIFNDRYPVTYKVDVTTNTLPTAARIAAEKAIKLRHEKHKGEHISQLTVRIVRLGKALI